MTKRSLSTALLLLILVGAGLLKSNFEFGLGPRAHDADYYYDIARHVSEGQGLKSNLSLYFQGFKSFPHRVTQSPVWPLVLGASGAAVGIDRASTALPNFLYFVDLILLYLLALRLQACIAGERPGWLFRRDRVVNFGHVAVLIFATNVRFFRFTSVPNNEAMAFFFVLAALLALDRAAQKSHLGWAAFAGTLGSLALLTRVQALAAAPLLPLVLLLVAAAPRRSLAPSAAALAGAVAPLLLWAIYLASWNSALNPSALLGMETQFETAELGVISHTVSIPGLWPTLLDRLGGLGVAFHPSDSQSYVHHFNALVYLVPIAALHFGLALLRRGWPERFAISPRHALVLAMLAMGVGMLLPVHMSHMAFSKEWLFGFRHGLPLLFLILPSLAYLDAYGARLVRVVATTLLVASLVMNALDMRTLFAETFRTGIRPHELEFVNWIDRQLPTRSAITTRPWELGIFSRSGYHWILCGSDPRQTMRLIQFAGADYVVVLEQDRRCPFVTGLHPGRLEIVASFGGGRLLVLAPKPGVLRR